METLTTDRGPPTLAQPGGLGPRDAAEEAPGTGFITASSSELRSGGLRLVKTCLKDACLFFFHGKYDEDLCSYKWIFLTLTDSMRIYMGWDQ